MGLGSLKWNIKCCVNVNIRFFLFVEGVHGFQCILKGVCDTHTHIKNHRKRENFLSIMVIGMELRLPEGAGFLSLDMFKQGQKDLVNAIKFRGLTQEGVGCRPCKGRCVCVCVCVCVCMQGVEEGERERRRQDRGSEINTVMGRFHHVLTRA